MEAQKKIPATLWIIVAVVVLVTLVSFIVRSRLSAASPAGRFNCRYIGLGTNTAGVVVSVFELSGPDRDAHCWSEAVVFDNQGVITTNSILKNPAGLGMIYRLQPDHYRLELPFTAPTNAWQLQMVVSGDSLPGRIWGILQRGNLKIQAHGWPNEYRVLSSEVPPQVP